MPKTGAHPLTRTHMLLVGSSMATDDVIDIRIAASIGYRGGQEANDLQLPYSAVPADVAEPSECGRTRVYVTNGHTDATRWRFVADLAIAPADDGTPALQLRTRSGRALPFGIRHAAEQVDRIVVLASQSRPVSGASTPSGLDWETVILHTAEPAIA